MFDVCQDRCGMKVGTDGVLLGAWARGGRSILDIGTGTGLIALMMAQRFAEARVTAIDIDVEACAQAEENIQNSPFASRIDVEASPLQDFSYKEKFDSVVSNPPFFVDSLRNPDSRRSMARHAYTLSYRDLFRGVVSLMADDGEFSAVIPAECLSRFVSVGCLVGLSLVRRYTVRTTPRKPARRYLVAFAFRSAPLDSCEVTLQNHDGSRSEWYDSQTKNFYIK